MVVVAHDDDHVLDPARHVELTARQIAEVAGAQPALDDGLFLDRAGVAAS